MLRSLSVIFAIAALALPVAAQPPACEVTIARAPDAIRAQLEAWIRTEPRCVVSLEVRVIESADGLYVFARDGRGFTRERTVPDAATVGALIASWIADDSVDGVWLPIAPVRETVEVTPPPTASITLPPDRVLADASRDRISGSTLKRTGLVLGAAGAIAIAGSAYFGFKARDISHQITSHPPDTAWFDDIHELERRGQSYEDRSLALMVSGGTLIATGTIVYLVGRHRANSEARVSVTPAPTRGGVGVSVAGRF